MCDYSLMEFPNRLAVEGEILVVHRFRSGSLGLASSEDHDRTESGAVPSRSFWSFVKDLIHPSEVTYATAVCIPPGARVILHDVPIKVQKELSIGPVEDVTFVQMSDAVNAYRDAVRFRTGQMLRLQELQEGQRVEVADLGYGSLEEPNLSETSDFLPVFDEVRRT
jgi:hypothetical protein